MRLSKEDYPLESQISNSPYFHAVGSLMHAIVNSRPNLAYYVTSLAQYLSNLGEAHKQALKRTLRYIKGTLSLSASNIKAFQMVGFYTAFLMLIGPVIRILDAPLLDIASFWQAESSHGIVRNNSPSHYPPPNQSTWP